MVIGADVVDTRPDEQNDTDCEGRHCDGNAKTNPQSAHSEFSFANQMHAEAVFGIISREWQSVYHFTVGGQVEDTRLTTLLAYRVEPNGVRYLIRWVPFLRSRAPLWARRAAIDHFASLRLDNGALYAPGDRLRFDKTYSDQVIRLPTRSGGDLCSSRPPPASKAINVNSPRSRVNTIQLVSVGHELAVGSFVIEVAAGYATLGFTPAPAAGLN
jgi:hypothetical protein